MWQIQRAVEIAREEGFRPMLERSGGFYNSEIWPLLPSTAEYGTYNRVAVKGTDPMLLDDRADLEIKHRVLDAVVPWSTPSNIPDFKQPNIDRIHDQYRPGDDVVIIGGGIGVSAVHSARIVGPDGRVIIYEADEDRVRDLERTLQHNQVLDFCEVRHAIVGEAHLVDSAGGADVVDPSSLSPCDALELDCEGAELEILQDIESLPEKMIVELHHRKPYSPYSSPDSIRRILEERGYAVRRYDGPWVNGLFVAVLDRVLPPRS